MKKSLYWVLGMVLLSGLIAPEAMACEGLAGDLCLPVELQFAAHGVGCPNSDMTLVNPRTQIDPDAEIAAPFTVKKEDKGSYFSLYYPPGGYVLCDNTRERLAVMNRGESNKLSQRALNYLNQFQTNACKLRRIHPELNYPELECINLIKESSNHQHVSEAANLPFFSAFATETANGYLFWSVVAPQVMSQKDAKTYCKDLGDGSARLPTKNEFIALSKAMGSSQPDSLEPGYDVKNFKRMLILDRVFSVAWFWSESVDPQNDRLGFYFSAIDGSVTADSVGYRGSVRCVVGG